MKRIIITALLIPLLLLGTTVFAADSFYCEYVPKTETGTVFYVDIYCEQKLSSAVMEISYDSAAVEYRSVSASGSDAQVRDSDGGGKVKIAFVSDPAQSGQLCRLSFKALREGECSFTLSMDQACGSDLKYITGLPDHTLKIKLGKDDIVSSSSSSSSSGKAADSKKSSEGSKSKSGSGSYKNSSGDKDDTDDGSEKTGGLYDMRIDNSLTYILLGAGGATLLGAIAVCIVFAVKKSRAKKKAREEQDEDRTPEQDYIDDIEDFEDIDNTEE